MPVGAPTFCRRACAGAPRCSMRWRSILKKDGHSTAVGDEGGYAPDLKSDEEAIQYLLRAIEEAGYKPYDDFMLAIDAASSEWKADERLPAAQAQDQLHHRRADRLLGDDGGQVPDRVPGGRAGRGGLGRLEEADRTRSAARCSWWATTCSSPTPGACKRASTRGAANSILIKLNQIGSLWETIEAVQHGAEGALHGRDLATVPAKRPIRPSPISPWRSTPGRSRPARPAAASAWTSTTASCASRKNSARPRFTRARPRFTAEGEEPIPPQPGTLEGCSASKGPHRVGCGSFPWTGFRRG